jgi:hypothetical protein
MLQLKSPPGDRVSLLSRLAGSAGPLAPGARDERLDMFRGLALVMIFINHVPGTVYEQFTNRNFGFSDAAEAFVFMSGVAAGLAYSSAFAPGRSLWLAIARPLARARQLYFVHLTITFVFLAIFAAAAHFFGLYELLLTNNLRMLVNDPLPTIIGIPLLTHQFGYLNILPLYATLLVATPLLILVGQRHPWWLLAGSVALWAIAGQFRLNFPNYPTQGGWFFNPLSWQLLFVVGLLCGMAMKRGESFFRFNMAAFLAALAFVVFILVWVKVPALGAAGRGVLSGLSKLGLPFYITAFDKSYLSLPRLSHALALFYVLASLPFLRGFAASAWATPLRLMGRQGLAIFAVGTVISLFLQAVKAAVPPDPITDGLMLGTSLVLLVLLAWALTATTEMRRAAVPARVP